MLMMECVIEISANHANWGRPRNHRQITGRTRYAPRLSDWSDGRCVTHPVPDLPNRLPAVYPKPGSKAKKSDGKLTANFGGDAYVQEVASLKTQFDIFRFMKRVTEAYRGRAFMVLNLPPITSFDLQGNTIITSWPAELLSIYDQEGLIMNSPVLRRLRTSTLPFFHDTRPTGRATTVSRASWQPFSNASR